MERLPVSGFVLAGGLSSRMGTDKAMLPFLGRPMVEIALGKLRGFCADVSIAGNRDDLGGIAPVVHEALVNEGPVAGVEAGLSAAIQPWVMFLPVDAPLVPAELLRAWVLAVLEQGKAGCAVSTLLVNRERQPAFCVLRRECLPLVGLAIQGGERRLAGLWMKIHDDATCGWLWACDAAQFMPKCRPTEQEMERWFANMNTPQELAEAELLALHPIE